MHRSLAASAVLLAILSSVWGCRDESAPAGVAAVSPQPAGGESSPAASRKSRLLEGLPSSPVEGAPTTGLLAVPRFVDVHEEVGLPFVFDNGSSRGRLMMQSTSGGAAWLDYDRDGWQDLYLPQGGNPFEADERRPSDDELYRSLGGTRFENVSEPAIPLDAEFGHGVVVGDFDEDGFDDVYVSNVGLDVLYRNCGDGTFEDVTQQAGIRNPLWASSAAWADLDLDGDLDLYVCNYVDYDPFYPIACLNDDEEPGICHPKNVDAVPNCCYFNQGDGTFRELADERGLNAPEGKSLGVVVADFNGDDLPDVYVANDTTANHLFLNQGHGTFSEQALGYGCALSGLGQYQASMGIAYGDYDENGYPDLYVAHFTKDSNTLYANHGDGGFEDATRKTSLHLPTLSYLAFGAVMADFDANGRQDLMVTNGHIDDWRKSGELWKMPPQLFTFDGANWQECGADAGDYFQREWLGRGIATADYDNDGDMDLAVIHQNDPMGLLRNDSQRGHWLKLQFIGRRSNRHGVGVKVNLVQGNRRIVQQLAGGTSYCSGHQPVLFFGLGESAGPCRLSVHWPSGIEQTLDDVGVDQTLLIQELVAEAS